MHRGRAVVPVGVLLVAVLAAFGVQLHNAQRDTRDAAERRFEQRARISAALTQSVFGALGSASAGELARRFGGPPDQLRGPPARMARQGKLGYVALVDERGDVIARAGQARPPRDPGRAGGILADVRRTAAGPLIDYGLPFRTASGKRVLLEGLPVAVMRSFLDDYLRRLPNPDGARLVVTDSRGGVLASVTPRGSEPAGATFEVAAAVPGTTWLLRLRADHDRVLAGSGGGLWLGWMLLGGLALAILAGLALFARVIGSSRRTSAANGALRESEGKLCGLVGALEEAVLLLHADGRVELLNASAKALAESDEDVIAEPQKQWMSVSDDGVPIGAGGHPRRPGLRPRYVRAEHRRRGPRGVASAAGWTSARVPCAPGRVGALRRRVLLRRRDRAPRSRSSTSRCCTTLARSRCPTRSCAGPDR